MRAGTALFKEFPNPKLVVLSGAFGREVWDTFNLSQSAGEPAVRQGARAHWLSTLALLDIHTA